MGDKQNSKQKLKRLKMRAIPMRKKKGELFQKFSQSRMQGQGDVTPHTLQNSVSAHETLIGNHNNTVSVIQIIVMKLFKIFTHFEGRDWLFQKDASLLNLCSIECRSQIIEISWVQHSCHFQKTQFHRRHPGHLLPLLSTFPESQVQKLYCRCRASHSLFLCILASGGLL